MGILSHDDILHLRQAIVSAGLAASRTALLAGLDAAFTASLPEATASGEQVLVDLHALNEVGDLADGTVPLIVWLKNATAIAGPRSEARTFRRLQAVAQERCAAKPMKATKARSPKPRQQRPKQELPRPHVLFDDEIRVKSREMETRAFHVPMPLNLGPLHVRVFAEGKSNAEKGFALYVVSSLDAGAMTLPVPELREKVSPAMSAKVTGSFCKDVYLPPSVSTSSGPDGIRLTGAWCVVICNDNLLKSITVRASVVANHDA